MAQNVQVPPSRLGSYDFYSPFMAASIVTRDGTRYPLLPSAETPPVSSQAVKLTGLSATGGESQEVEFLPYLTSMNITLDAGYVAQLSATLNPPYLEGRKLLDSTAVEYGSSHLEVQFGYSAGRGNSSMVAISPTFKGLITKPDISFGTDITIQFNAQGTGGYTLATTGMTGIPIDGKGQTYQQYLQSICDKMKLKLDVTAIQSDQLVYTLFSTVPRIFSYGNETYYSIIYESARDCACYVYFTDDTVRIVPMKQVLNSEPVAEFVLFDYVDGKIGPEFGRYPILSVSTEHAGIFLDPTTRKLIQEGLDPKTGKLKTNEVSAEKTAVATNTDGDLQPSEGPTGVPVQEAGQARSTRPPTEGESTKDQMAADFQSLYGSGSMGIKLEIETLGIPDILPLQNIKVTNVSQKRIDGNYTVMTVKHSLSSSGFTTNLTVIQNATKLWDTVGTTPLGSILSAPSVFPSLTPNPNTVPAATSAQTAASSLGGDATVSVPTVPQAGVP